MSLIRFDEISFIKFNEIRFIKFNKIQFITFDKMSFVRFDEKSFNQIWWKIVYIKLHESLSSNLMNRFRQVWWIAFVEFDESLHQVSVISKNQIKSRSSFRKIRIEQSKHKRWNDQAWSRERIHKNSVIIFRLHTLND